MFVNKFLHHGIFNFKMRGMNFYLHIKHFLLFLTELVRGALKAGETFCKRVEPVDPRELNIKFTPEMQRAVDDGFAVLTGEGFQLGADGSVSFDSCMIVGRVKC